MPRIVKKTYGIDGLAGEAWSDDNHTTHWTEGETINRDDILEEVILKTMDQPGVTLFDHVALSQFLAKNIREWGLLGGDTYKKTRLLTRSEAHRGENGPIERSGEITHLEEETNE
jgi:hypothetical protein